jgi:hypothetical protein
MMRHGWRMVLSVLTCGALLVGHAEAKPPAKPAAGAKTATAAPAEKKLDPKAIDILKASSARLAAAKTMSFTAIAEYESPSRLGPPLVYTTLSEVTLQRPDKLRVITPADGPASEFYYDGKVMMAYAPAEDLVAVADAPPTIDAALKAAYDSAAIYFPFTDVLVADPYADLAPSLQRVFYIGQSKVVGNTTTDMIGIVTDDLFGQMWIGAEDKLPRGYRVTYLADRARLRQQVVFSNWQLDGQVDANAFTSAKASSAKKMNFARPDPQPPKAVLDSMKHAPGKPAQPAK